jgi:hypothetical protein
MEAVDATGRFDWAYSAARDAYAHTAWTAGASGARPAHAVVRGLAGGLCAASNVARRPVPTLRRGIAAVAATGACERSTAALLSPPFLRSSVPPFLLLSVPPSRVVPSLTPSPLPNRSIALGPLCATLAPACPFARRRR